MNPIRVLAMQRKWRLLALVLWTMAVGLSLWQSLVDIRRQGMDVALEGARNMFQMILVSRAWNTEHGGVYVPVTPWTQPNPYLKDARRDLETKDGMRLTLVHPAEMTRQMAESDEARAEVRFHITSLDPLRPGNEADPWEAEALESFETGTEERYGLEPREGAQYLRYMAPLMVEPGCLKCHAHQGYRIGDVRGGISVTQPYEAIRVAALLRERRSLAVHLLVLVAVAGTFRWLLDHLRAGWLALEHKVAELERTRGELLQSEKMASLGRLVAGFAHEINTPVGVAVAAVSHTEGSLAAIDGLLQSEEVSEREFTRHLDDLREGSRLALANLRRASDLVQRFKRSSVDRSCEHRRQFEMQELIDDVRFALTNQLKRLAVRLEVDCPQGLKVYGVPGHLEQVLTNLILNSVQHGFAGGTRPGTIRIQVETPAPGRLRLLYSDDGAGMVPEAVERVFEPFFTTGRGKGGTGLGMYLSYNLVTVELGGSIRCESAPGRGARFEIEIPYVSGTPEVTETIEEPPG